MARLILASLLLLVSAVSRAADNSLLLLQKPTLSSTQIVFVHAGDLWSVPRDGGEAKRLTTGAGIETNPIFSPDGSNVAFTGEYDGNVDVFVVAAAGGGWWRWRCGRRTIWPNRCGRETCSLGHNLRKFADISDPVSLSCTLCAAIRGGGIRASGIPRAV